MVAMQGAEKKRKVLEATPGIFKDLGSSFESTLYPLADIADFKTLYDTFKKEHPRADHYPYAYRLGAYSKSSDDGEPSGTAGRAMLSLLEDKDIEGLVIVARFFGGTKLGVPRLRRAFVESASNAIAKARFGVEKSVFVYDATVDYSTFEILKSNAKRLDFSLFDIDFGINVHAHLSSGVRLDGLGEKLGIPSLDIGEPKEEIRIEEE